MKTKKLTSLFLSACLLFSNMTVVHATEQTISEPSDVVTDVTAEISSDYSITLPKLIVLDSETKSASYTVSVEGDIQGSSALSVVPDSSFALKSDGKDDVTATVTQDKTMWTSSSMGTIANGVISAEDLSAGSWVGTFTFHIDADTHAHTWVDGVCDTCQETCEHVDVNGDGKCDVCTSETDVHTHEYVDGVCNGCHKPDNSNVFAVYSLDDESLRFYNREDVPTVGSKYNGLTVTELYTDFADKSFKSHSDNPWYMRSQSATKPITSAIVEDEMSPEGVAFWFYSEGNLNYIDVSKLDVSHVTDFSSVFMQCGGYYADTDFEIVGLSNWDVSNGVNFSKMFQSAGKKSDTFRIGDLSGWDVSNGTNFYYMFCAAGLNASKYTLNISNWDVSNATNHEYFNDGVTDKVISPF